MENTNSKQLANLKLIPGKQIATAKETWLKQKLTTCQQAPKLRIIQVGDDPASTLYVNLKVAAAKQIGIDAKQQVYATGSSIETIIAAISKLNADETVHGIMVQSPIPGLDLAASLRIFNAIVPDKDVDGLSYASLGKLWQLKQLRELTTAGVFIAATPLATLDCLLWLVDPAAHLTQEPFDYTRFQSLTKLLAGKRALIINRSNIVGKPLLALLTMADATVTLAHSKSKNLTELIGQTDFILTATGADHLFAIDQFYGKTVIDIGINNNSPDAKVRGDVKFDLPTTALPANNWPPTYLAAVPGGVGPLTVINLLANTFLSYSRANGLTS